MTTARKWWAATLVGCGVLAGCTAGTADAAPARGIPPYERDAFGDGWADLDNDCQDTRQEILIRDLVDEQLDADGCKVLAGTLHDSYTGTTIPFTRGRATSDDVQIDHVVPLAYAWRAGAYDWSDAQLEGFANDPANLVAVDGPTNNRKSDRGPARFMPPNEAAWCGYAAGWRAVLTRYELVAEPADEARLADVEAACLGVG
jgi:5-methylcytosine-specific restriction endonuclease McrA